jgi:nitronate monooxygenase
MESVMPSTNRGTAINLSPMGPTEITRAFGIDLPIFQAPMAGHGGAELAAAVSEAGGLGGLGCALMSPQQARDEIAKVRLRTKKPLHVNFFCHVPPRGSDGGWRARLAPYYGELGLDRDAHVDTPSRAPFDEAMCDVVVDSKVELVSFHFGLPEERLLERVKGAGSRVASTATTVAEARWLAARGCDVIIAQGFEAGGHRGMFLGLDVHTQVGTLALVPQVVDAVRVPVVAAGGIADGRGVAAVLALGASAAQVGTAYLQCPEATVSALHRAALAAAGDDSTAVTNVFTGRPARAIVNRAVREVGPLADAPEFPMAAAAILPLRRAAEARGSGDFTSMWSGQAVRLARSESAADVTRRLAAEAAARLDALRSQGP